MRRKDASPPVLRNADPELTQSLYDAFGVRLTTPNGTMWS
jgi:hypothetical protein